MSSASESLVSLVNRQKAKNDIHKPVFYRLTDKKDKSAFEQLLSSPGLVVVDGIREQIQELIKFQHPSRRFSTNELQELTNQYPKGISMEEFGVWVFYPWSNRLVHLLDEEEFIIVRTSRNHYKITPEERDELRKKKIGVIGLSVGQSVSVTLAMERVCGELRLADFDLLELTNLNRIRTGVHNLGIHKVYSVAREIAEIDPFITVRCFPEGLLESNMDQFFEEEGRLDLLVEESDGFDIKILSRFKARKLRVPVVMEASDRCMVDVERFDLEPERPILHGIVKHLDVQKLKSLQTNEEKIPYMLDVLGFSSTSVRLRASMLEMQHTINTWPQLASAVTMGGGIAADVSRRVLLNHFRSSGRYYVDIDQLIGDPVEILQNDDPAPAPLSVAEMQKMSAAIAESDFPAVPPAEMQRIVEAAALAPSFGNQQPWKFLSRGSQLLVFHDRASLMPSADPEAINSFLSVGAAIENIHLAAQLLGYAGSVRYLTENEHQDLVAVVDFRRSTGGQPEYSIETIKARKTSRNTAPAKALTREQTGVMLDLVQAAKGLKIEIVQQPEVMAKIAAVAGLSEKIRVSEPVLNREYFSKELRGISSAAGEGRGIDLEDIEMSASYRLALEVVADPQVGKLLLEWDKGSVFEKQAEVLVRSSSGIGLISSQDLGRASLLEAGRALESLWLYCTKNNLGFQPISLPLSLIRYLKRTTDANPLALSTIEHLRRMEKDLSGIFHDLKSNEGVLMFRVGGNSGSTLRTKRKPLKEFFHISHNAL